MPNSLRTKIKKLFHDSKITEEDMKKLIVKLDGHDKELYNKAIDNFVKEICKMIVQSENNGNYRFYAVEIKQAIADLAEKLKAGGENE